MNYTYMLKCADGSFYTGWTNQIKKRTQDHKAGRGAKYTKGRLPAELVYYEQFATKEEAMKREWEIKKLSHQKKLSMLKSFQSKIDL